MMNDLALRLKLLDLRITEATVLTVVGSRLDLTSSQIGKALDIQRANMVPILNRLEAVGLIRRELLDGKSQAILLTPDGFARASDVFEILHRFETALLNRIDAQHRPHLLPALQSLID